MSRNFLREAIKQSGVYQQSSRFGVFPIGSRMTVNNTITNGPSAQRFVLPDGGRIISDKDHRALRHEERLSLPFPIIALEYNVKGLVNDPPLEQLDEQYSDRLALAFHMEDPKNPRLKLGGIGVSVWAFSDAGRMWVPFSTTIINRDPSMLLKDTPAGTTVFLETYDGVNHDPKKDHGDVRDEAEAVISLMNALACSNVSSQAVAPSRTLRAVTASRGHKINGLDSYHVLMVDAPGKAAGSRGDATGSHASPREHVRRGHIRRLDSKSIWVNSTVVNAGRTAGKVDKHYQLRVR